MNTTVSILKVAVIYLRVSTEEQARSGYSLPEQREQCLNKARSMVGRDEFQPVFFEDTAGGDILERPALELLREFVREHRPAYFVCMDPDRFSRELFIQLLVTREIEAAGTQMVFVQHDYQNTAEGQLFYALRGAVSQYEKAKILQRTKQGARRKVKGGQVANGTKPFGYNYDTETDTLVVVPEEARWVEQIFKWTSEHLLPSQIVDRLNALDVSPRHGGLWRSSTIQGMLRSKTYTGSMICFRWNTAGHKAQRQLPKGRRKMIAKQRPMDEWITVPVPAIISQELFDAVQATLRKHKRSARGTKMLSGMARCGLCGGAIHYVSDRTLGHVLRCHNRYPRRDSLVKVDKCTLPSVKASTTENSVWMEMTEWFADPEGMITRMESQVNTQEREGDLTKLQSMLAEIHRQMNTRRREQAVIVGEMAKDNLDQQLGSDMLAETKTHLKLLQNQLSETEALVETLSKRITMATTFKDRLSEFTGISARDENKIRYLMEHMPEDKKKAAIKRFVREILVYPKRRCEVIPNL